MNLGVLALVKKLKDANIDDRDHQLAIRIKGQR